MNITPTKLTIDNAEQYVGKKLYGKFFHYWPVTVKRLNGVWYCVDACDVMVAVPPATEKFNTIWFDRVEE